jgi:hypothetical protein
MVGGVVSAATTLISRSPAQAETLTQAPQAQALSQPQAQPSRTASPKWTPPDEAAPTGTDAARPSDLGPNGARIRDSGEARPERPARIEEIVYLNAESGFLSLSLTSLAERELRPAWVPSSGGGAFYGAGAGVRFKFLTLGGRVRGSQLGVGSFSTIVGELGARVTLERFEPYFTMAAGRASLIASSGEVAGIRDLDIHGYTGRAGLGLDYYADKNFSVGASLNGEVVGMARPGVDLSTSPRTQAEERVRACQSLTGTAQQIDCTRTAAREAEGASVGFGTTLSVGMGVHF